MLIYSFEMSEKEKVYLSAGVIDTIFDSLKFLKTSDKLKIKKNKGLFYNLDPFLCDKLTITVNIDNNYMKISQE